MQIAIYQQMKQQLERVRQDRLLTNSVFFFANTFATSGLSVLFWWVAARFYPADVVGSTVVMISMAQLLSTTAQFGLGFSIVRYLAGAGTRKPAMLNAILTVAGGASCLLGIGTVLIGPYVSSALTPLHEQMSLAILFVCFVFFLAIFQLLYQILAALRVGHILLGKNIATSLGRLLLLLIAASYSDNVLVLLFAFTAPMIMTAIVVLFIALPTLIDEYVPRLNTSVGEWRHLGTYSASSYVGNLLHDLPHQLLPQIVATQLGSASTAYFFIAWNMFGLLTTLGNSFSLSLFVEGSHAPKKLRALSAKTMTSTVITTTLFSLLVIVFANPLLMIFGADYAANGTGFLRILALSAIPAAVVYAEVAAQRVKNRLRVVNSTFALIALISLLFPFANISQNLTVVGMIWGFAQLSAMIYLMLLKKKEI